MDEQPHEWTPEEIAERLARSRGDIPEGVPATPELMAELVARGQQAMDEARDKRRRELLAGDVEPDPDLMDQGDDVAEEVATAYGRAGARIRLFDSSRNRGKAARFTQHEQREAAQRAQDLMLEQALSQREAASIVAADLGVYFQTIVEWGKRWGINLSAGEFAARSGKTWDLRQREELFARQYDALALLTDRALVWITGRGKPPPDWNAAAEMKTLAISAAILHDKMVGVEDLKLARGLRDLDSEQLQGELAQGRERLALMQAEPPDSA